ncbi:MAG: ABC transporter ATP-binding protein [Thermoplasmatota archaeon]
MDAPVGGVEALRLEGIKVGYAGRPNLLDGLSLAVPGGQVVSVAGDSGSGKSTLLAVAAGLEPVAAGRVVVLGVAVDARDQAGAAKVRHDHVGLVFQHINLLPELTVRENIELPLRLRRVPRPEREARVEELVQRFGLVPLVDRQPGVLSGGEQQRVAIARALAARPGLLLVDEPTSALDDGNAKEVVQALQEAARDGAGVLVATHDSRVLPAGRVVRLKGGKLAG